MNQKNNQRFQETDRRIREYFLSALSERELSKITVQEIRTSVSTARRSTCIIRMSTTCLTR